MSSKKKDRKPLRHNQEKTNLVSHRFRLSSLTPKTHCYLTGTCCI